MAAPCVVQARLPSTMAEAVIKGHRDADPVRLRVAAALPDEEPVVQDVVWCDSVAPFGNPVVPLVYWMLIGRRSPARPSAPRPAGPSPPAIGMAPTTNSLVPVRRAQVDHPLEAGKIPADVLDHGPGSRSS